jgi:hypothetical protein
VAESVSRKAKSSRAILPPGRRPARMTAAYLEGASTTQE